MSDLIYSILFFLLGLLRFAFAAIIFVCVIIILIVLTGSYDRGPKGW